MKRSGNLKCQWCNYDSLLKAFHTVKQGKSLHYKVIKYEMDIVSNLNNLLKRLEDDSYQPSPLREFYINIPKKRLIHAPAFEDRIVHHALMDVIEPLIDNRFIADTFACRKNKGVLNASNTLQKYIKNSGYKYYLKLDIMKFFYSIDHSALSLEINRIIKDIPTLNILKKFYSQNIGLPLGNVTSQLLANLALSPIDHYIKRVLKVKYYVRYMDDMVILGSSKSWLKSVWANIGTRLSKIGLLLNSKSHIGKISAGVDFVGYKTWQYTKLIRKSTLYTIGKKLKHTKEWNVANSYLAHAKHSRSIVFVSRIIARRVPQLKNEINNWLKINEVNYAVL